MNAGGYQILDFTGVTLNSDTPVTVTLPKHAEILRTTNKIVHLHNLTIDNVTLDALAHIRTSTGARDGKVYGFIGPNSLFFNISTDDNNVTFTPA